MTFDSTQVEPNAPREIIPPGKYRAHIVASEMQATKNGNGQFLKLEFEILDGPQKGQKLWDRLNLFNPNQQAVEIAQRTLSAICRATGQATVQDSEQLHFKPLMMTVKVKQRQDNGEPSNEIGGYEPAGGVNTAPKPGYQPTQAAPHKPAGSTPPWRRTA
jgi:hypothetical protein